MSSSPLHQIKLPLSLSSWGVFGVSLALYWITADPGVSYWDCPEYVTVASRMEVGHPPGNPLWMLAMRVATLPFLREHHAYVINLCSGLLMALAAFFLCRIIFTGLWFFVCRNNYASVSSCWRDAFIGGISFCGALCYSFCDSAWFSAVEAEVYAMSAFLSALTLWIMVLWWFEPDLARRKRLAILVAYLLGLSLGVHQLNLLMIPVFCLMVIYKRNPRKISPLILWCGLAGSVILIGIILAGVMPGTLYWAQIFELFFVNHFGFGYDSGVLIYCGLIASLIILALTVTPRFGKKFSFPFLLLTAWLSGLFLFADNLIIAGLLSVLVTFIITFSKKISSARIVSWLWMIGFILLGYSSYSIIMIRGKASPAMNEGAPDNIFSLASYIGRDQYPSTPLLFGATPYSKPLFKEEFSEGKALYSSYLLEKGTPRYLPFSENPYLQYRSGMVTRYDSMENDKVIRQGYGYLMKDYDFKQKLTPELDMWFPRITSRNPGDLTAYEGWTGMNRENMERVKVSETIDSAGNFVPRMNKWGFREDTYSYRPTYYQNLRYFLAYQNYYMYFRYLFWNFIGRQNDFASTGEIEHGNFLSGIPWIDDDLLGGNRYLPSELGKDNKGRNIYFGIPFIMGILGILYLLTGSRISRRVLTLITLLFVMTGIAIVVYLNQTPGEPRERDYTFLVSYMAFAMWISAGLTGLNKFMSRFISEKVSMCLSILAGLGVVLLMVLENFDDHDRRGRYQTEFFASSILDFEYPSVIFSHGDNSTFPVWYSTQVLGKGESHTPVDVTYMALPSYIVNLQKQNVGGLNLISDPGRITYGGYVLTKLPSDEESRPIDVRELLEELFSTDKISPVLSSSIVKLPASPQDTVTINLHDFTNGSSYLRFNTLALLDILAGRQNSEKPKALYFPYHISYSFYKPLMPALRPTLFGYLYAPELSDSEVDSITLISLNRELKKLKVLDTHTRYIDPLIADKMRRYRGELLIAAKERLEKGDVKTAESTVDIIEERYPFSELLPGDFTQTDTTFYESDAYIDLLDQLYRITRNESYRRRISGMDSLVMSRRSEWLKYYKSLSPEHRSVLSNRARRRLNH